MYCCISLNILKAKLTRSRYHIIESNCIRWKTAEAGNHPLGYRATQSSPVRVTVFPFTTQSFSLYLYFHSCSSLIFSLNDHVELSKNVFLQSITQAYDKFLSSLLFQFAPQHNPMRSGYSQVTFFICLIHKYLHILIFN